MGADFFMQRERQIASSAPAVLAALKRLVADWDSVPDNVQVPDEINVDAHWQAARDAIAAAETF